MDYEKKYKEALERAKRFMSIRGVSLEEDPFVVAKELCEEIFPELTESEDERMLREFNDYLCEEIEARTNDIRDEKDRRTLNMLCYVLKKVDAWLERQKEQKPSWSEEDKEMIERLIRHTQEEYNELCNDTYGHQEIISDLRESCRERMNWLENRLKYLNLQSHWKPSEEQIRALERAIVRFNSVDDIPILTELRDKLKKL